MHLKMETGPSRKRLRRSTRSCYPCRKRKVKCQLTDESVETCAECLKSGTRCTLQPPGAELSNESSPANIDKNEHEARLERIEALLKKLVEAREQPHPSADSTQTQAAVPDSLWNEFLFHSSADEIPPTINQLGYATPQLPDTSDVKQSLIALLPSAQDAVTIVTNTTAWLWGAESPPGSVLKPSDTTQLLEIADISRGSAMDIAKALLLFALYMQQLPARFDVKFLESHSIETAIELIVGRVKLFIASREDEAYSLDDIECLTLISLIHLNDGALRKAWMTFRRILDISRLKDLHKSFSIPARNSSCSDMALRRRLWLSAVCGDSYCSLVLGLEPATGIAPFGPDSDAWDDPFTDYDANVQRRIGLIVTRIAQRNAVGLYKDIHTLQQMDMALEKLQDSLPSSWWRVPSFGRDQFLDSAKEPNRLMCQIWFYQARIFAHMPFAFGNPTSLNSFENCMETSRIILQRCLGLQHAKDRLSRCRSVDQSVFVAAVVLILAKMQRQPAKIKSRHDSDRALIEQVIDSFDAVGKICSREHVARQSSEILSAMLRLAAADPHDLPCESSIYEARNPLGFENTLDPEGNGALDAPSSGMEDIITSSIQPMLDEQSPAYRFLSQYFASDRRTHSKESWSNYGGLFADGLINSNILQ